MKPSGYYRYPTLHKNSVVFVCEDDLWTVPTKGGLARRLTANLGAVSHPALSPDGEWLAFIGRDDGESEVYVMPALGGAATRLTFLGSMTTVLGWTPDSQKIVFASNVGQPFGSLTPLYTISLSGGQPELLPYGPARALSFGPNGGVVIGRRSDDLARWKRYRGGTAGEIWLDAKGKGNFKLLLKSLSHVIMPMWLEGRIYFLSDHEGIGNLYSCALDGKEVRRHTHHEDYYVRHPATDGRRIVYRAGADLYLLDPAKSDKKAVEKIKIEFHSPRIQRNRKFVTATKYMDHYSLHPQGHSVTLTTRGQAFALSNWEGPVIQYGEAAGVRQRLIEWLNDGQRLVLLSDTDGEEVIEIHPDATKAASNGQAVQRLTGLDVGRPLYLSLSPKKDRLALGNHRFELILVDLESKTSKLLDKSAYGRIYSADWSPDGEWLVYTFPTSLYSSAIKLVHVESGASYFVTTPRNFRDYGPSFDPTGKYIYFISRRDFDPVYDAHYFDLNFPRSARPYLVTLQKELPNPFIPLPGEQPATTDNGKKDESAKSAATDQKAEGKEAESNAKKEEKPLQIDLEGIQNRVIAFPVPESRYGQIRGATKDKVYFTSYPIEGSLNRNWRNNDEEEGKGALEMYDLAERKKEFIVSGISEFEVSRDHNYLIYRNGKHMRVLKAGEKPDNAATGYTKKSGWLDLSRVKVAVNPPQEWQQMFREAWRLQRDHFWTEDMAEVDWQAVYQRYFPLIDRVTTRSEFSDLLWEMQGELGTSHAYELGGDYRPSPNYDQGFLGADFSFEPEPGGYRIEHIIQGDTWLEKVDSPLNRLGVNIKVGDILLAIDGQRLSREVSPQQLLVNRAGVEVQLTLVNGGPRTTDHRPPTADKGESAAANGAENETKDTNSKKEAEEAKTQDEIRNTQHVTRTVLVKTLKNETEARYREWVEQKRQQVHTATQERVGYLHIPNMGPAGYAEFHRYYLAESEREGLIVDLRFNGGGHVSQLLLEKLARKRLGYDQPRYGVVSPYPDHSVLGPLVALTNEYAGSDGDIFTHGFKLLKLGPVIGKRTWGGVIGISPRHALVDGTITTQPEFSFWFEDVGWSVENYGSNPDIEVDIKPQDYAQGKDPQLERALQEIANLMAANPPSLPDFGPRPSRALPKLPKLKKNK
jgi:tricorn protease